MERLKRLLKNRKLLTPIAYNLHHAYIELKAMHRMKINQLKYGKQYNAGWFGLKYVNPEEIQLKMLGGYEFKKIAIGRIVGGDWDLKTENFNTFGTYTGLIDRFIFKREWEEIKLYKFAMDRVHSNGLYRNISTEEDVLNRFAYVDKLFDNIKADGYKLQKELKTWNSGEQGTLPGYLREITVNISRDGSYILDDGRHRLSIAKILKLEKIPVCILVVHRDFILSEQNIMHGNSSTF
jgi:hypothetical protein